MRIKQILSNIYDKKSNNSILNLISMFLFAITAVLLIRDQFLLLNYIQWGDES